MGIELTTVTYTIRRFSPTTLVILFVLQSIKYRIQNYVTIKEFNLSFLIQSHITYVGVRFNNTRERYIIQVIRSRVKRGQFVFK